MIHFAWSQVLEREMEEIEETKTSQMHRALYSPKGYQKASEQTYP
jgi:hypothetical protein